ncbi:MAG: hypothetical protein HY678_04265 [Chloroflexi bacterium]|nr:hypothetical protein [Chloroflexota bacterium]
MSYRLANEAALASQLRLGLFGGEFEERAMPALVDVNKLPNDKFGYRIYGVMAHLPLRQANQVRRLHRMVGALDLATEPHCSIDNFWGPKSLDDVKAALGKVTKFHVPFVTEIDFKDLDKGKWGAAFGLRKTPELMALQRDVIAAVMPHTQRIFDPAGDYWPHTTVLLDAKPGEMEGIDAALASISLEPNFPVESIELIGRVGPSRGGDYVILDSFKLRG